MRGAVREPKSAPPFLYLYRSAREERCGVRAAVCSLRGRKEEVQMRRTRRTRGQKEGQTGRPERGTRGCHGYRRIPTSPRCHGDDGIPWSISFSSHRSLSRFLYSTRTTRRLALALAKFRLPRSRGANLLSDDDGRLALSPSPRSVLPSRRIPEKGKSKKRETDGGDSPRTCTHARYLVLSAISRLDAFSE